MSEPASVAYAGSRMAALAAWIGQNQEEILEPDLPIVDPHHHLWDRGEHTYLLPQFMQDVASGHDIRTTVYAECFSMYRAQGPEELRCVGETEFVVGQAAMAASETYGRVPVCSGIVGAADLALGARVRDVLEAQIAAGNGRFKGIRYATCYEEGVHSPYPTRPGMLGEPGIRAGFAVLQELGLSFDAWLYHPQLPELSAFADAFPIAPIVMDHVGGPVGTGPYAGKHAEVFPVWQAHIRDLAKRPNVHMKLGGLAMRGAGFNFDRAAPPPDSARLATLWRPYIETCIEAFGPERCMFESNFPVDQYSCSYRTLWNAFKRITAGASAAEKAALYEGTARRFYRL